MDETLEPFDPGSVSPGDVVGIGVHTFNSLRGYEVGRLARERGATVVFGGVHASLYPEEARELGGAHAVVKGDGDAAWPVVLSDCTNGGPQPLYDAGRIEASEFATARWDLMPPERYMWGSVQTVRGCPKHCSFCSVGEALFPCAPAAPVVATFTSFIPQIGQSPGWSWTMLGCIGHCHCSFASAVAPSWA